ncbi:LAME_0G03840g1_1 [Lachancea meyersii CBS 8951]|uniref:LAME_0G03840g1_1 n=1 Tax=Lachancea meyersii CBS 8951 TaxID=1266667 RepID=A0A1G4K6S8_9SACH|nr:LAME_0G03840g1_1 [Lachancea meyersii CBS 8951]
MLRIGSRTVVHNSRIWNARFNGWSASKARFYAKNAALGIDSTVENNMQTETNRISKTLKKFWSEVATEETGKVITLTLDKKPVRTPLGNNLAVSRDRRLLALALQHEWANLATKSIKPHSLPITSLVSRCIDLEYASRPDANPELVAKIGADREDISHTLLRYLDTDTLLCLSPRSEFEGTLRAAQDKLYLPLISAAEKFLSDTANQHVSLQILDADLHGLRGNAQPEKTKAAALKYLRSLSMWDLAVFEKTVLSTKSFLCGLLLLQNKSVSPSSDLLLTMEKLAHCATLETVYQVERWGEVEDTHDVDYRDIRRNVNAAAIVAYKE